MNITERAFSFLRERTLLSYEIEGYSDIDSIILYWYAYFSWIDAFISFGFTKNVIIKGNCAVEISKKIKSFPFSWDSWIIGSFVSFFNEGQSEYCSKAKYNWISSSVIYGSVN